MDNERTSIDDTIINLPYLQITGATYLMETLTRTARNLALDQELTAEQKRNLKNDAGFTSKAVLYLGRAKEGYNMMMKSLDVVEQELNKRVKPKYFDLGLVNMLDLLKMELIYLTLAAEKDGNSEKIQNYLKKYSWPEDLQQCIRHLDNMIGRIKK